MYSYIPYCEILMETNEKNSHALKKIE